MGLYQAGIKLCGFNIQKYPSRTLVLRGKDVGLYVDIKNNRFRTYEQWFISTPIKEISEYVNV